MCLRGSKRRADKSALQGSAGVRLGWSKAPDDAEDVIFLRLALAMFCRPAGTQALGCEG